MDVSKLKSALIEQKKSKFKGNIYHFSQVTFAYNSNKIEGGRLSEDQTESIFNSELVLAKSDDVIKIDDLIETRNHFKLFDYILDDIDAPLSKEMLINMHTILKNGTSDCDNEMYNVGGFKIIPNIIGVMETTKPEDVEVEIDKLLNDYNNRDSIGIEDIIDFHVKFERIHPFSDGNGRVGRIIMYKECLKNNILPFIILDMDKPYYIRGLKEYDYEPNYLVDTCLHSQDIYESVCNQLAVFDRHK